MQKPAIAGGKPVRKSFLVFGKPKISAKEIREVMHTIESGWLGTGPKTKLFEDHFRKFIHAKYAIALNSCTAGLHLALEVLGIHESDEVITTPLTFPSTANVIVHHQAVPVFVDIDKNTWNIDPEKIKKAITKKTRAIIPVHLHGRPCAMTEIRSLAAKHGLYVVEDAAHAAEAWYRGKKIGSISDFTAFSFYVTKNIMTGEGGMLTTNRQKWADEARIKSLHGISHDAWKRYSAEGFKPYETLYPGYKYNMMDLVASFGLHQLEDVEKNLQVRETYWKMYDSAFSHVPEITIPAPIPKDVTHARHLYAILLNLNMIKLTRDEFVEALRHEGIGAGVHFSALHLHSFYRHKYSYKPGDFPISEFVGECTVSLPLSPAINKSDIRDVIAAVFKIIAFYRK